MDLSDLIARNAAFTPSKPAIRFEGETVSYAELDTRIGAMARALKSRLGVGRGDRVAILALNRPEFLVLVYACARLGAMLTPLNWRLAVPEQQFILADAGAKALLVEEAFAAVVPSAREALPELKVVGLDFAPPEGVPLDALLAEATGDGRNPHIDLSSPLLVVYTSGTTGRPKGAVLRQEALHWNMVNSAHMHGLTAGDHVLTALPMFHVGGLNIQTTPALQLGATVTLHRRFDPGAVLEAVARDRPSLLVLVPATMQAVTEHPAWGEADLSSLRCLTTGSSAVPQALIDAFEGRAVPVIQVYGSTETAPIAVYHRVEGDGRHRPGSTGLPGLVTEARIVDEAGAELPPGEAGEIVVRGPTVLFEYWGNEAATAEALREGWYHTGDIGWRDADGHFYVRDRKKNMIITGGENVYPAEVERVLLTHPDIAEAAVVGRPDPRWGETVVAVLVPREGTVPTADSVRAHLEGQLARFKLPREIRFAESLPRNAMGKVQHFLLAKVVAEEAE